MIEIIYAVILVLLGMYNWRITNLFIEANEQLNAYNELILQMATELESLGSPNVKILKDETIQQH